MTRLTADRIRQMQASGQRPPPPPRRNSNSNSNSHNRLVNNTTNNNNLPQMGSPVVTRSPAKTIKKAKRDLTSTVKKYVKQKRNLIAMNAGHGGSGHRYWNNRTRR